MTSFILALALCGPAQDLDAKAALALSVSVQGPRATRKITVGVATTKTEAPAPAAVQAITFVPGPCPGGYCAVPVQAQPVQAEKTTITIRRR